MGRKMAENNQAILDKISQMVPQAPVTPDVAPDPTEDADAWFNYRMNERVNAEQEFNETLITTGVGLIDADEAVKADPTLKQEIIDEIQSGRVVVNRGIDPKIAADNAVTKAKANILTRRMTTPVNPLGNNTPTTEPLGGVTPPAAPAAPKPKLPPMSDLARDAMKRFNISEEEAIEILSRP
jgi:hypothetical protein